GALVRKLLVTMVLLVVITGAAGWLGLALPAGFVPQEDQGYMSVGVQLPAAASVQRTGAVGDQIDALLSTTDGGQHYTAVIGAATTNTAQYFLTLAPWDERDKKGRTADAIIAELNDRLAAVSGAKAFALPPPAIPGVGASGGITFMLEDRAGKDIEFLAANTR